MIDFHSHLIPGVDDGAVDLAQARSALEAMQREGVRTIVLTPHFQAAQTGRVEEFRALMGKIDHAWEVLRSRAAEEFPELRLERGVELMLDLPKPNLQDPRLRLAGTPFVLVEFVGMAVPPQSGNSFFDLRMDGWSPILAHPERYAGICERLEVVKQWRSAGVYLQINAGSLLGRYGSDASKTAWQLLERGWVDYISSDYHGRGRLAIQEGRRALEQAGGELQAKLLMETNPERLLSGLAPEAVPPLTSRGPLWKRVLQKLR